MAIVMKAPSERTAGQIVEVYIVVSKKEHRKQLACVRRMKITSTAVRVRMFDEANRHPAAEFKQIQPPIYHERDSPWRIPAMLVRYEDAQSADCRIQLLRSFGTLKFLVFILSISHGVCLLAQTIEIKLVDGRNGRPMVGESSYVNVWVGLERKDAIAIPTDAKGVAGMQLTLNTGTVNIPTSKSIGSIAVNHPVVKYDDSLRINVPYVLCVADGSDHSWLKTIDFSTKTILQHGYVSPNTCGKITMPPQPGQVVFFVRPFTFLERLKE